MIDSFADVNGIKICYDVNGKGYPIVLVHGFGDRKEHWRAQVGELSKHFKVIRLDNRGAGKSDRPDGVYTMELFTDDIKGLLDELEIKKTHIIGHSLGGMIVLNFSLKYPKTINKIVLINTLASVTPPGVSPDQGIEWYIDNKIKDMKALQKDPLNSFIESAKKKYSREFWNQMKMNPKKKFHNIWSVEDLVEEKTAYGPTERDYYHLGEVLTTHNTYERLHEIKNETLLLAADKDKTIPMVIVQRMHEKLPNSKFIVIKNAGHQSLLEYPHIINQHIIKFLKK
jgi:3-oxoadipate enol-lactonase